MYLFGYDTGTLISDTGEDWDLLDMQHRPDGREVGPSVAAAGGRLWYFGGTKIPDFSDIFISPSNDVWFSTDAFNWTRVEGPYGLPIDSGPSVIVYDDRLWVLGTRSLGEYLFSAPIPGEAAGDWLTYP
jgi:hypothetical protein